MKDIFQSNDLLKKREVLDNSMKALKKEFIGLDRVIDELDGLMTPWLLFPEAQTRPTVINLWGMTGSGKTALIQRLVELLEVRNRYVQLDMGEFESDSSSWIKNIFTEDLEHLHQKPCIICLDEFQFAKTLDESNKELGKDKLRVVWEMVDTGKINYTPHGNSYYFKKGESCLFNLLRCIERGVRIENGKVVAEVNLFKEVMRDFFFEQEGRFGQEMNEDYLLSRDFVEGVYYLFNDEAVLKENVEKRIKVAGEQEIVELVAEGLKTRLATRQLDLSKALLFVVGNLDEAYYMSNSLNPDISADQLHEATKKITVADVKSALRKRFRNEQIARLGNNHIIYTSFTNADFRELIRRQLDRQSEFVKEKFGFEIVFDRSVVEIVYKEGVFPAQGTRPVYTTVKNLIEGNISKILLENLKKQHKVSIVEWRFEQEKFVLVFKDADNTVLNIYEEPVLLKTENLRRSTNSDLQAHTAVHESGHAIAAALSIRIVPAVVVSKTADSNSDGFCQVIYPEGLDTYASLKNEIITALAGFVAERLVFGNENTSSGVRSDISRASAIANSMVKFYAMGLDPVTVSISNQNNDEEFVHTVAHQEEAYKIIRACELEAEELLKRNKLLLLKMSEYLTSHSRMEEAMIREFVLKYATEEWVRKEGFKTKEHYFSFKQLIADQIREEERNGFREFLSR